MDNQIFSGKYEVQREIAKGGMGVIYLALDITLRREVVIKVLHPQFSSDPAFTQRFLREARAMARLDHPNIMRIYAVEEEHNAHYIVMEYSHGKDLKHIIREQEPLSLGRTLPIAIQMTKALAYAHQKGIVHRDIKPSNIMLVEQDQVKITDFGIAAALDESSVTMTGTVIGTPEYMSPEQTRGEQIDARSDLYSLGIVVYEMFTGETPYRGLPGPTIIGKLAFDSSDPILSFPQHVPLEIQDVILRLIKKQRNERMSDTHHIIETLNRYLTQLELHQPNVDATVALTNLSSDRTQATKKTLKSSVLQPHSLENSSDKLASNLPQTSDQTTRQSTKWIPILVGVSLSLTFLVGMAYLLYQWPLSGIERNETSRPNTQSQLQAQQTQTDFKHQREQSKEKSLAITGNPEINDKERASGGPYPLATTRQDPDIAKVEQKHEKTQVKTKRQRPIVKTARQGSEATTTPVVGTKQQAEIVTAKQKEKEAQRLTALHTAQIEAKAQAELARQRKEAEALAEAERQQLAAEQAIQAKAAAATKRRAEIAMAKKKEEEAQRLTALHAAQIEAKAQAELARQRKEAEALAEAERQQLAAEQAIQAKAAAATKRRAEIAMAKKKEEEAQRLTALHAAQIEAKAQAELARQRKEAEALAEAERQQLAAEQAIQTKAAAEIKRQAEIAMANQKKEAAQELATEQRQQRQKAERLQVTALLKDFQKAYESQNLPTLQQISTMDAKRIQYLQLMFKSYSTIRVTTEIQSINKQQASAKLLITKLVDQKGQIIKPNLIIRETKITIPKEGEQWGKIQW